MKKLILIFLIFFFSCNQAIEIKFEEQSEYCATEPSLKSLAAHELIRDDQQIVHRLRYHYFTNQKQDTFSTQFFHDRTHVVNYNFAETKRSFVVAEVIKYYKKPEEYPRALRIIEGLEVIKKRSDLRNHFMIEHFAFWGKIFESDDAIDIFVYDNISSGFAGVALAIQSKTIAVRFDYMDPLHTLNTKNERKTLEHELGHALGLKHTHHKNEGDPDFDLGFNNEFGDGICDTPKSPNDLFALMDDECEVRDGVFREDIPKECIENSTRNYMSYIKGFCRTLFTKDQIRQMDFALENNQKLQSTCPMFDFDTVLDIPKIIKDEEGN